MLQVARQLCYQLKYADYSQASITKFRKWLQLLLKVLKQLLLPHCRAAKHQRAKKRTWESGSDPAFKLLASAPSFCACKRLISPNPNIFKKILMGFIINSLNKY